MGETEPKEPAGFSPAWKALHWLLALLVLGELALGQWMSEAPSRELRRTLLVFHQSNGLAIWTLLGGRIVWRLRSGLPPWPPEITTRQRQLLYAVEGVLYLAMFAMPLSGMALSMVAGFPISLFGWFEIPGLLGESDLWHGRLEALHGLGAKAFLATILAHALLVLALDRGASPGFLARMLPSSRERRD